MYPSYLSLAGVAEDVDDVEELSAGDELGEDEDVGSVLEGGHHLHHERAPSAHRVQDSKLWGQTAFKLNKMGQNKQYHAQYGK